MTADPPALQSKPGLVHLPVADADVLDLHGRRVLTQQIPGATLIEAQEPGIYTATAGDRRLRVAVNVADAAVTEVNANRPPATAPVWRASHSAVDPWSVILVIAAGLLVLEWWTYNRRLTV
jgi:hypothetical protein